MTASAEDTQEDLEILAALRRAELDIAAGRSFFHEEVVRRSLLRIAERQAESNRPPDGEV